jgi:hypothetical protein
MNLGSYSRWVVEEETQTVVSALSLSLSLFLSSTLSQALFFVFLYLLYQSLMFRLFLLNILLCFYPFLCQICFSFQILAVSFLSRRGNVGFSNSVFIIMMTAVPVVTASPPFTLYGKISGFFFLFYSTISTFMDWITRSN